MTNSSKHKVPKLLVFYLQSDLKFFLYADKYSIYSIFFFYTLYALQHPTTMILANIKYLSSLFLSYKTLLFRMRTSTLSILYTFSKLSMHSNIRGR